MATNDVITSYHRKNTGPSNLVKPESIPTSGFISCPSLPLIFLMLNKLRMVAIANHRLTSARCLPGQILIWDININIHHLGQIEKEAPSPSSKAELRRWPRFLLTTHWFGKVAIWVERIWVMIDRFIHRYTTEKINISGISAQILDSWFDSSPYVRKY